MKNAIALFVERHPIMTFILVVEVAGAARDTVVGVARAITGKYPPAAPKPQSTELPKVDISIHKPESASEEAAPVEGEVTSDDDLDFLK